MLSGQRRDLPGAAESRAAQRAAHRSSAPRTARQTTGTFLPFS